MFKKKPRKQQQIIETSDEDSGSNIQYADESDISFSDEEITLGNIGKFVIVKVSMYLALHKVACTLSQIFCMSRLNVKIVSLKFK